MSDHLIPFRTKYSKIVEQSSNEAFLMLQFNNYDLNLLMNSLLYFGGLSDNSDDDSQESLDNTRARKEFIRALYNKLVSGTKIELSQLLFHHDELSCLSEAIMAYITFIDSDKPTTEVIRQKSYLLQLYTIICSYI